jgi:hypothetical protein
MLIISSTNQELVAMEFSEHGFITKVENVFPDLHLIHLKDGRVVGINAECIVLYASEEAFYECATNELPTIDLMGGK